MKPSLFEYVAPDTVDEAIQALDSDPGAMVLAGGQSLIPAMNFRLASASRLVDLRAIAELRGLEVANGVIRVGAMVRHRTVEQDQAVVRANPLLQEALTHVAHVPIRNRGTVVGSLCHADAAAEMPLVLLLTGGSVLARSISGERRIAAEDFFRFHMTTSRAPGELVVSADFPVLPEGAGHAFEEYARRHGDYAIAAVGVILECDGDGTVRTARIAACGVGSRPVLLDTAAQAVIGTRLSEQDLAAAAQASEASVTAAGDIHATPEYRKHLLGSLLRRALLRAAARAAGKPG